MNKIIKKQVLATFALVTIMAGVLIGTNCIYAAQDGKETTTIRLINQTYFNVKNIKVTWNDGKEQTVNTLGSHDSIDFSSDAGSVYKMDVTGTTQSGEKFTGHFKGLVGKDTRVFIELDENADVQGGDAYSYTWFEQAWIPSGAEHQDAAKLFISYLYSDKACEIFAKAGAIQPVLGIADKLEGDNVMFYSIYDNGAKAAMGNFASFEAIPGIEVRTVFFDPVNSLVSGDMTEQEWIDGIISASDQMRANLK